MNKENFKEKIKAIKKYVEVSEVAKHFPDQSSETIYRYMRGVGGNNEELMGSIYKVAHGLFEQHKQGVLAVKA